MPAAGRRDLVASTASLLLASLLAVASVLALGRPDVGAAADFLSTARPTHDQAVAAIELIVWGLVAGLVLLQVATALRRSVGVADQVRRRRTRAALAFTLGVVIFFGGALHHQESAGAICCGDVVRADRLVH